jgi:hypothetical protein
MGKERGEEGSRRDTEKGRIQREVERVQITGL